MGSAYCVFVFVFMSVFVYAIASNRGRNGEPQAAFLEGGRASLRAVAAAWDHQRPNKPTPPLLNNEEEEEDGDDEAGCCSWENRGSW